jgi:membrane protein
VADQRNDHPTAVVRNDWKDILRRSIQQFKHDDVSDRAAALTYFGVQALFPGLLILVSIFGFLGRGTTQKFLDNIGQLAPGNVRSFLDAVISQTQGKSGAATAGVIVGALLAFWSASGYIAAFMRASNAIYDVDEGRPAWKTIPVRLGVTLVVVILLVATGVMVLVTGSVAEQVGKALGIGDAAVLAWEIAKWPVLLVLVSLLFSVLYWACPNVKQPGFKWLTPGGVVAVVMWLVVSGLFAIYVAFSDSYNRTYGSLATVIIFLVWLWLSNISILVGAEFNAEIERQRAINVGQPADREPYVELRDTRKLGGTGN